MDLLDFLDSLDEESTALDVVLYILGIFLAADNSSVGCLVQVQSSVHTLLVFLKDALLSLPHIALISSQLSQTQHQQPNA